MILQLAWLLLFVIELSSVEISHIHGLYMFYTGLGVATRSEYQL